MREYFQSLNDPTAIIGLVASIVVLISMCFNTRTRTGEVLMRSLNLVGSVISVVYGILLGPLGAGMLLLNGTLVFVNLYYLVKSLTINGKKLVDSNIEINYNNISDYRK